MYSVTVLLSTYNGEKFLKDQIESLLIQKDVDIYILARDDGSRDSTVRILEEYSSKYSCFDYYSADNLGPAKSFLDLIRNAPDSDYYALCDQDDVWDEDKLICAVRKLSEIDNNKPNLYYSNLRIVDQKLNFYRMSHEGQHFAKNKYSALTENLCTGCTAVFNKVAQKMLKDHIPDYCTMHDTWIYMLCSILGNTIYDQDAHISYRQHGGNAVGTNLKKKSFSMYKEKFFRIFKKGLQPRYYNAINFAKCFGEFLSKEDREKLLKVIHYKDCLKNRMSLFFDAEIKASSTYRNIRFKMHIIWGTV